ncbi:porin [Burkholderia gladioli]|uniref:porin n=1 Tax=Burkholderia gladioli TaxID=28095 RepID=UPI003B512BF0
MTPSRYLRHARDARHSQSLRTRARRRLAASLRSPLASGLVAGVAGLALGAAAGPAQAQSSVTLYGTIDTAIVYANNAGGKRQFEMNSSNVLGNRWGLRGSEDLGNGLRAVFDLENGYSSTTGGFQQGGDLFGRQAWVGLASQRAGTLTAGRQYDAVVDFIGPFIAGTQWATYLGGHPGDLDNTNNDYRSNNSVKYTTPTYRGLRASGLYSFGGTPGQFGRNSIWSLGVGYTGGPIVLGAAYVHVKDPNFSYFGNNSSSSATGSNMAASRVYSGYASAGNEQIVAVGGTYTAGPAIIGAVYTNTRFGELGAHASLDPLGYRGSASFHNAELNLRYYLTPVWLLGAAYDYTRGYGVNHVTYQQGDLGITYILSKRTQLYLVGLYQHASGTDSSGQAAVANINGLSASSTPNQVSVLAGITHRF